MLRDAGPEPPFAATTTVPVLLRSFAPTPSPATTFTGILTGGNGNHTNIGQTSYYQFRVHSGTRELSAQIQVPDPADTFVATLVDPVTGESAATAASTIPDATADGTTALAGGQLHVLDPHPGVWTLSNYFYGQVAGAAVSEPFTVTLRRGRVPVSVSSATGPDSAASEPADPFVAGRHHALRRGQPVTFDLHVTNTGAIPEAYFVDARGLGSQTLVLPALNAGEVQVPITAPLPPLYRVPTHTTQITATATAGAPIFFDYWSLLGDPDLISQSPPHAASAYGTFSADPVTAGEWAITPFQTGPDGEQGVASITAHTSLIAITAPFDSSVTAPTGDLWAQATGAAGTVVPIIAGPGETVTIPVTITPRAAVGTAVAGTLYVDGITRIPGLATWFELPTTIDQAADVAALRYRYTVRP